MAHYIHVIIFTLFAFPFAANRSRSCIRNHFHTIFSNDVISHSLRVLQLKMRQVLSIKLAKWCIDILVAFHTAVS